MEIVCTRKVPRVQISSSPPDIYNPLFFTVGFSFNRGLFVLDAQLGYIPGICHELSGITENSRNNVSLMAHKKQLPGHPQLPLEEHGLC